MKELSIEQKAKRYDEAINIAKSKIKNDKDHIFYEEDIIEIFSELKEKTDEEMIQKLIAVVHLYYGEGVNSERDECLEWLKKQSKNKPIERKEFTTIPFGAFDSELIEEMLTIPDGCVATIEGNRIHIKKECKGKLEAIKEEKVDNANNVLKFKEGEYVVDIDCGKVLRISEILSRGYLFENGYYLPFDTANREYRLWTIADAKDGDVVCYKDEISLYKHDIKNATKEEITFGGFVYHCCYDGKRFITDSFYSLTEKDKINIHLSTKEQRNILFTKMKEACYEWDSKNKELKSHYKCIVTNDSRKGGVEIIT